MSTAIARGLVARCVILTQIFYSCSGEMKKPLHHSGTATREEGTALGQVTSVPHAEAKRSYRFEVIDGDLHQTLAIRLEGEGISFTIERANRCSRKVSGQAEATIGDPENDSDEEGVMFFADQFLYRVQGQVGIRIWLGMKSEAAERANEWDVARIKADTLGEEGCRFSARLMKRVR